MLALRRFHFAAALGGALALPLVLFSAAACEPEHGSCDESWQPGALPASDLVQCAPEFPVCSDDACLACTSDFAAMDGEAPCPKRNPTCVKTGAKAGQCCGQDQACP